MQQHLETTTKGVIPIMKSQIRLPTKSSLDQIFNLMISVLQLLIIKSGKFLWKFFHGIMMRDVWFGFDVRF
jgi:hypothetical protein